MHGPNLFTFTDRRRSVLRQESRDGTRYALVCRRYRHRSGTKSVHRMEMRVELTNGAT